MLLNIAQVAADKFQKFVVVGDAIKNIFSTFISFDCEKLVMQNSNLN